MRRLVLSLACIALFAPAARGDLVSHWKFDGDLTDSGPGGNHGTFGPAGEEPTFVPGLDGSAISMDGSNDYVKIAQTTKLPAHNLPVFTIAFFAKAPTPTSAVLERKVFCEASTATNTPLYNFGTANAAGNAGLDAYVRSDGGSALLNHPRTARPVFDDKWHHVAWIDANGTVTVYVDGVRDTTNFNYTRATITTNTTTFGAMQRASVGNYYLGLIDDARLYDHALSQDEVRALAQAGCDGDTQCAGIAVSGPPGNAPGLYTFTASAADSSGDTSFVYDFVVKTETGTTYFERLGAAENSISIGLGAGRYTVSVTVEDEPRCLGSSPAATCVETIEVVSDAPRLVSRWSLDGNADDSEPSGNDGLVVAGADATPPQYVEGYDGTPEGAIALSGDDYIRVIPQASLPVYVYPSYSISLWVKGGLQSDKRVYSEGSSYDASPLLNIGTDNTGATGAVDIFIRNNTGAGNPINHRKSVRPAYDGTWHHIAWVDDGGWASVYVDGVRDSVDVNYTRGAFVGNRISIGAILRATPAAYFTGAIDEVRVYNYALSAAEVSALVPEPAGCPGDADTHLVSTAIAGPEGNGPGAYTASAEAADDSGDPVIYTFVLRNAAGRILKQVGPGAESTAAFDLQPGTYRIEVAVDDDLACKDEAPDAREEIDLVVHTEPHLEVANWLFDGSLVDGISGVEATMLPEGSAPTFGEGRECRADGAIALDGVQEIVKAGSSPKLPLTKRVDFSISLWVKGLPQSDRRIFSESSSADTNFLYNLGTDNTGATASLDFFFRDGAGTTVVNHAKSTLPVMDGAWHHVAWIDSNGTVSCYIDGVLDPTNFSYARPPVQSQDITTLGGIYRPLRDPPGSSWLKGSIDDVRLFNYALSEAEALALYGAGPACCPDTQCVGLDVQGPPGNADGTYTLTATAADGSGSTPLFYRFTAADGIHAPIVVGPQTSPSATVNLSLGVWTIWVDVSDDSGCLEESPATRCSTEIRVVGVAQLAGDVDQSGERNVGDVVRAVRILFAGFHLLDRTPAAPPCSTGQGNLAVADVNGDARLDISDVVYLARYLFLGGPPPVQGLECFEVPTAYGCPENPGCP